MIFQMQFLSLLRLLEANIGAPFAKLMNKLKWLNLHFDIDMGSSWLGCDRDVRVCCTVPKLLRAMTPTI